MARLFLHIVFIIIACLPLIVLVFDMTQRYPAGTPLVDIRLTDWGLLIAALGLPLFALSHLGVNWRADPE